MKKKDILKIIEAKETIKKDNELLSTIREEICGRMMEKDEKYWFPNILEFESQFNVLKKEIYKAKEEVLECMDILGKCTHDVQICESVSHGLFWSDEGRCPICGKNTGKLSFDVKKELEDHVVIIPSKYYDTGDYRGEDINGMSEKEIMDIIFSILDRCADEDEVDLYGEFSKLNLAGYKNILIITGTNLEWLDDNTFVSKKVSLDGINYFNYFKSLSNARPMIITREEIFDYGILDANKDKDNVLSYTTLESLEENLSLVSDKYFDVVLDFSQLYSYQILDGEFCEYKISLNLEARFLESYVIEVSILSEEEKDFNSVCNRVKKLVKNIQ